MIWVGTGGSVVTWKVTTTYNFSSTGSNASDVLLRHQVYMWCRYTCGIHTCMQGTYKLDINFLKLILKTLNRAISNTMHRIYKRRYVALSK